jgi:hypothetical protein
MSVGYYTWSRPGDDIVVSSRRLQYPILSVSFFSFSFLFMAAWALYRVTFRPLLAQANTPFHSRTGMSHLTRDKERVEREREREREEK